MYVLRFSFMLKHLSNVYFADLFHFEAVLKERRKKENVHFVVFQRVHDGKKTVKSMFCCFVKDQNKQYESDQKIHRSTAECWVVEQSTSRREAGSADCRGTDCRVLLYSDFSPRPRVSFATLLTQLVNRFNK